MAATTNYSDVATIENAPTPSTLLSGGLNRARVRVVQATMELPAVDANSLINICKLYKGDRVLMNSFVIFDDLGNGCSLDIGDTDTAGEGAAADIDRYADGIDTSSAGIFVFNSVATCIDKVPYEVGEECWLQGKVLGAGSEGTLVFTIFIAQG
jgi:hypothetical protein